MKDRVSNSLNVEKLCIVGGSRSPAPSIYKQKEYLILTDLTEEELIAEEVPLLQEVLQLEEENIN
ncbi:hypothetical protein Avbf_02627 [Armadillidium vulgare]|nr:hypothetical protein Avbf_02627 [Armadillidium vulgare]